MSVTGWQSIPISSQTIFGSLAATLARLGEAQENAFPVLDAAETLLAGADYSGEHDDSPYVVYCVLVTSLDSWASWENARVRVRRAHLTDSRRMSFKRLGDGQRSRALMPFLTAADSLEGLLLCFAVNKACPSFFDSRPPIDLDNPDFAAYRTWKPDVLDRAFLTLHLCGLLVAGLGRPGQNLLWFTDEDAIAANDRRLGELTQLFAWISTLYLTYDLGHCRCGTSRSDNDARQIEDFLAIPDLVAGALAEQLALKAADHPDLESVFWMHRGDFSDKTRKITWWLSGSRKPLRRLVCLVDPSGAGGHRLSLLDFRDQPRRADPELSSSQDSTDLARPIRSLLARRPPHHP